MSTTEDFDGYSVTKYPTGERQHIRGIDCEAVRVGRLVEGGGEALMIALIPFDTEIPPAILNIPDRAAAASLIAGLTQTMNAVWPVQ